MALNRYSISIQRQTNKLLKKMFGYKNVEEALSNQNILKNYFENTVHKNIDEISINEVKVIDNGLYMYAKYRTLKKITDLYIQAAELRFFNSKEWEEYSK